jgi:hypothetical protein
LLAARAAPYSGEIKQQRRGLQARFLKLPPGVSCGISEGDTVPKSVARPTGVFNVWLNSLTGAVVLAVAARSSSAICLLRTFSTVFAHAEALDANSSLFEGHAELFDPQSVASCSSRSLSTAFGDALTAAGGPV